MFVGREAEVRSLQRARERAPQTVLVSGPAGAGKTALVEHALGRAPRILRVSGAETERTLALGVVDQLLRRAATDSVLGALSTTDPLVLLVDDAQWIDPESIEALIYALRRLVHEPVTTVLAGRDV